jgi:transcriptional regulator with XRE-family HTH domain
MNDIDQRRMLGEFVRAHREHLKPEGQPGRRRTPGLRREELAVRVGISATWCTWIEQGRDVQPSPQTLSRLADALTLTRAERAYLFDLAGRRDPAETAPPVEIDAPAAVRAVVQAVDCPAYALDRFWNACCWNDAAARLFSDWLGDRQQRNQLSFIFLEPSARQLLPDWENRARRVLAEFRADYSHRFNDARMRALVDSLSNGSAFFAQAWTEQSVLEREGGLRSFNHPLDGRLTFEQHTFTPAERPDYKLVVLTTPQSPRDET